MEASADEERERPVVTFIRDVPADEDFFSTHTHLARAIVETIRSNEEMKVVGLLGRWGSGKSTVAKMIIENMSKDDGRGFRVFTYDAWLHQSDPLRRSFLESLLGWLVETKVIEPGKWGEKLRELSGQIEDTEIIEAPSLSADARWIGLSLLLVPIGAGLLGLDTIKEAFGQGATWLGLSTFGVAVAFLLMPGIVWFLRYMLHREWRATWKRSKKDYFSKSFWAVVDEEGSPAAALRIFTNHSVKRANTRTVRSGEPSSLEFGRVFQEIMREATADKKRFVILIDNLDRVAGDEALQMWATIRSFFLASHETEGLKHEAFHPTVILPIDRHAIEQLFAAMPDTGRKVPDEEARVEVYRYIKPVAAKWPRADFIVGNPPFIGKVGLRAALGDGYFAALFSTTDVPESADFVMHWWDKAATAVRRCVGSVQSFRRRIIRPPSPRPSILARLRPRCPTTSSRGP